VLLDDGDYQSSETPTTKASSRTREKLWQAIERVKMGHSLVNDGETPRATAEQARVHLPIFTASCCYMLLPALAHCQANPRATHYWQVEDVAEWLAKMSRQADWMSGNANFGKDVAILREQWKMLQITKSVEGTKEADRIAARKQRLVTLFGSDDCYSANVHANTNDLGELVNLLVRLDRLPTHTPLEGLKLLAQAWDEHRGKFKEKPCQGKV